MLHRMHFCCIHDWLLIGIGHAKIKCCDDRVTYRILSGYVDAWNQADVVDSKTSDFFYVKASFSLAFMIAKFVDKGKEER